MSGFSGWAAAQSVRLLCHVLTDDLVASAAAAHVRVAVDAAATVGAPGRLLAGLCVLSIRCGDIGQRVSM